MNVTVEQYQADWIIHRIDPRDDLPPVGSFWSGSEWMQNKDKAQRFQTPDEAEALIPTLPIPEMKPVEMAAQIPVAFDDSRSLSAVLARAERLLTEGRFPSPAEAESLIMAVRSSDPHRDELGQRLRDLCELAEARSRAESQFTSIMATEESLRHKIIEAMTTSNPPTFEEEWLDFKSGNEGRPDNPKELTDDAISKTWSTALSGFANTGGGLLIWGIEASKRLRDGQNVDAASGLRLAPHPAALKSRLMELHHSATDPPIAGVRVEPIPSPAGGGFVVCLIPESTDKPHRAELVKNKPFYIRVGDDFVLAPRSILRTMFYPRNSPRYSVRIKCQGERPHGNLARVALEITITNKGSATAREPFVSVQMAPPAGLISMGYNPPWRNVAVRNGSGFQAEASIHPGATAPSIRARFDTDGNKQPSDSIEVVCLVYALDAEVRRFETCFDWSAIRGSKGVDEEVRESRAK
jgi:hypothetical protein